MILRPDVVPTIGERSQIPEQPLRSLFDCVYFVTDSDIAGRSFRAMRAPLGYCAYFLVALDKTLHDGKSVVGCHLGFVLERLRDNAMNDDTTNLDQAEEDILTYTVSDEALEAAANAGTPLRISTPNTMWCPLC